MNSTSPDHIAAIEPAYDDHNEIVGTVITLTNGSQVLSPLGTISPKLDQVNGAE